MGEKAFLLLIIANNVNSLLAAKALWQGKFDPGRCFRSPSSEDLAADAGWLAVEKYCPVSLQDDGKNKGGKTEKTAQRPRIWIEFKILQLAFKNQKLLTFLFPCLKKKSYGICGVKR